jgi:hypothetical protein
MKFTNTAIVYDELLMDIVSVLEYGWPAGPMFFHSLGSLIEAVVIHETVYFDPINYFGRRDLRGDDITSKLLASEFIQELLKAKALVPFPNWDNVEPYLAGIANDYQAGEFLADNIWDLSTFSVAEPGREKNELEIHLDLSNIPNVFSGEYLVEGSGELVRLEDPSLLRALLQYHFTVDDLRHVDSLNRRAKSYLDLGRNAGINVYPPLLALPHQVGAVKASNGRARHLYDDLSEKISSKLAATEDEVGKDAYARVLIPPLSQIILLKSKDSMKSLAVEICELRHSNRNFRQYLTNFEDLWTNAKTKQERLKMLVDYENAWKALVEKIDNPSTRIIYQLWDLLKKPTEILAVVGDKLASAGRKRYVIDRVNGLYDFWRELANAPVASRNQELIIKLFPKVAESSVWELAAKLADKVHSSIEPKPQARGSV